MKNVRNESGITLIELLAALVIGTMVIGLITTVLLSTFTQADVTGNHASLRQEANIILSDIRTEYSDSSSHFVLAFNPDNLQLSLGNEDPDEVPDEDIEKFLQDMPAVADEGFEFKKLIIYQITPEDEEVNRLSYDSGILNDTGPVKFKSPQANRLYVNFILQDENGLTFEVDTMVSRLGDYEDYQIEDDEDPQDYDALMNLFILAEELIPESYVFDSEEDDVFIHSESEGDPIQLDSFDYRLPIWYAHRHYENEVVGGQDDQSLVYNLQSVEVTETAHHDVTIVSKEDVTISDGASVKGFIFAPDGRVTISNADFEGTIIADTLEIDIDSGSDYSVTFSQSTIQSLLGDEDNIPFQYDPE